MRLLQESPDTQRNPEAVRLLGDLYLKIALIREAEAQYLSLLKPPLATLDTPAGAAVTSQTLGEIYEQLGNTAEAVKYYTEAQKLFQKAGNKEAGDLVGGRLRSLTSP
jgi:tetratricopeptide (TPR) repeat protein